VNDVLHQTYLGSSRSSMMNLCRVLGEKHPVRHLPWAESECHPLQLSVS
jgi:hypothetical protein